MRSDESSTAAAAPNVPRYRCRQQSSCTQRASCLSSRRPLPLPCPCCAFPRRPQAQELRLERSGASSTPFKTFAEIAMPHGSVSVTSVLVCSLLVSALRDGSASAEGYAVGIDLGTTNSVIGVADLESDTVEILPIDGGSTLRSQVNTAKRNSYLHSGSDTCVSAVEGAAVYGIKRIIGRKARETGALRAMEQLRDFVTKRPNSETLEVRLHLSDGVQMYPPEFISAAILARLRWIAENAYDSTITNAVITVPAYFTAAQKEATVTAAIIAGFETPRLLTEPVGAALTYAAGLRGKKLAIGEHIVVVYLAHCTFDVSVLRFDGEMEWSVLAIGGDESLGGDDLDDAIVTWLVGKREMSPDDTGSALCELKRLAERAKRRLGNAHVEDIELPAGRLFKGGQPGEVSTHTLHRETFLELAKPIFDRLMPIVDQVLRDAKLTADDINHVLPVGGSSRIPKLQSMLKEKFGVEKVKNAVADDTAVAKGATIYARSLFGKGHQVHIDERDLQKKPSLTLSNVVPLPLGVSVCSESAHLPNAEYHGCEADPNPSTVGVSVLLPEGSPLPARGSTTLYSGRDNQPFMLVEILEGGRGGALGSARLGNFTIDLPPGTAGMVGCNVTFALDEDGRLSAQATALRKRPSGGDVPVEGSAFFELQGLYHQAMPPDRICKYHAELRRRTLEHHRPRETVCHANQPPALLCSKFLEDRRCEEAEQECRKAAAALVESHGPPGKMDAKVLAQYAALQSQVFLPCRLLFDD